MSNLQKFAKYGTVALGAAITDWIVFVSLVTSGVVNPLYGQMVSRIAGGVFSFSTNKYWSFKAQDGKHLVMQGRRFLLLYGFSYCLSLTLFYVLFEVVGISAFLAKLGTDTLILFINFIVMNNYVFNVRTGISHYIMRHFKEIDHLEN